MNWTARLGAVVCRLMFSLRPRNRDAIQHLSDEQMRLGCREVLAYDLVIEKEAKHRAAVAGRLSLVVILLTKCLPSITVDPRLSSSAHTSSVEQIASKRNAAENLDDRLAGIPRRNFR